MAEKGFLKKLEGHGGAPMKEVEHEQVSKEAHGSAYEHEKTHEHPHGKEHHEFHPKGEPEALKPKIEPVEAKSAQPTANFPEEPSH